jgi:hypothetical protein
MGDSSDLTIDQQLDELAISPSSSVSAATVAIHADDVLNQLTDVAPPIHLSTTYRFPPNPEDLVTAAERYVCNVRQKQRKQRYLV